MSDYVKVAETTDLKPGAAKTVMVGDREVALFNVAGQFHALDNVCPHRGGPLAEGVVEGGDCICPWHGWRFNVTTGISPVVKTAKVDTFAVVIEGRDIKIKVN